MNETDWAMDAREAGDRLAIRECIDRFSLAMTLQDADAIPPLFLSDGSWGSGAPFVFTITGADAIGAAIAQNKQTFEYSIHMVHSVVIEIDGDHARATSVLQEIARRRDGGGGLTNQGVYHDELRRTASGWRFASRRFEPICLDRTAPASRRVEG